jgi:hypothetical protein
LEILYIETALKNVSHSMTAGGIRGAYLTESTKLAFKGTVSPDFLGFFMTYDIKSVFSAWALMVFKFFQLVVILIF